METYKKLFVEHFARKIHTVKNDDSNGTFQTCYLKVLSTNRGSYKEERNRFFKYLKEKDQSEQLLLLDESSKLFDAIAKHLVENPIGFEKLDFHKVVMLSRLARF